MDIIELYKSILDCAGLTSDADGFISVKLNKSTQPALLNGKRLVLPIQSQLTSASVRDTIRFHPLCENSMHGESEVISKLRKVFNLKLNYTFAAVAEKLLHIVATEEDHKLLNPDQKDLLIEVKGVDKTTLTNFSKIMINSSKELPESAFINFYLKRSSKIKGKKYFRGAVMSFGLYDELKKEQDTYYGVKLRTKDKAAFKQLYEYILPGIQEEESFDKGSNSDVAPFLDVMMKCVLGLASRLNDIIELFKDKIESADDLIFNSDWVETFDNLNVMIPQIRSIPMQSGNEGASKITETSNTPPPQTQQYAPPPPVQQQSTLPWSSPPPQQYQSAQPTVSNTPPTQTKPQTFAEAMRSNVQPYQPPQQYQLPPQPPQQVPWTMQQHQQHYQPPQQPFLQPQFLSGSSRV